MNSSTIKEKGFCEPAPLKGLLFSSLPLNKSGVFILVDTTLTGKPVSDIVYIGKSKNPAKRIFGGYLAGYGGKTTRKINSKLLDDGYIEKVAVSWMLSDDPKLTRQKLLECFKKEHGEYPAWNAQKKTQKSRVIAPKVVKPPSPRKPAKSTPQNV